jgi:hypothetical protein
MSELADPRQAVSLPAITLIAVSVLSLVVLVTVLAFNVWLLASGMAARLPEPNLLSKHTQIIVRMMLELVMLAFHAVTIVGALRMRGLRSYGLARAGAMLACIPCLAPCLVLGIPVGVWALIVLARPEVRDAFTRSE